MKKRMIVFAPHPDDETLACGGTIMKRLKEKYEVTIIVMTDGRHALSRHKLLSDPSPKELKEIRRLEAIKAAKILGVTNGNLVFWDFEDMSLSENVEALENKSLEILNEIQPTEVYFSYEKDSNTDHKAASMILMKSIQRLSFPLDSYQYSLFPRFFHLGPLLMRLSNYYRHNLAYVDVGEFINQKAAAIHAYKSQRMLLAKKQKKTILPSAKVFLKKYEVFVVKNWNKD